MEAINKLIKPDGGRINVILVHELGKCMILEFIMHSQLAEVPVIALKHHFSNFRVLHTKSDVFVEVYVRSFGMDINKILRELSSSKFQFTCSSCSHEGHR